MFKKLIAILCCFIFNIANADQSRIVNVKFIDGLMNETVSLKAETFLDENNQTQLKVTGAADKLVADKSADLIWTFDTQLGRMNVKSNYYEFKPNDYSSLDLDDKSMFQYRLYLKALIKNKHEIRIGFDPTSYKKDFTPESDLMFNGLLYVLGGPSTGYFKSTSIKVSYVYHMALNEKVEFKIGLTGKMNQLQTRLVQECSCTDSTYNQKSLMPLLLVGAKVYFDKKNFLDVEVEAGYNGTKYEVESQLAFGHDFNRFFSISTGIGNTYSVYEDKDIWMEVNMFRVFGQITVSIPTFRK